MSRTFRCVRELLYWEYAKLIAGAATGHRLNYAFVNATYQRLCQKAITPSAILAENKLLLTGASTCAYCHAAAPGMHWEHIIPRALGGPDSIDNLVRACPSCNRAKGRRDPYQWYASMQAIDAIPRLVLGKLLKLLFTEYERRGLLDAPAHMHGHATERTRLSAIFLRPPPATPSLPAPTLPASSSP